MIIPSIQKSRFTAILTAVLFSFSLLPNLFAAPAQNENRPKVIFIQDAHSNYEAQSQIRDILKNIVPQLQPVTILVEGTSESLDPSIFQFTLSRDLNKKITEKLSERGLVSGAELFTLEPESASAQFAGLENDELYQKEKNAFMSVIRMKMDTEPLLSILDSRLDALKSRTFNPKLKEVDRKFSAYKNGKMALLSWFDYLRKLVPGTRGFSLNDPRQSARYPNLVRLAISYAASQNMDTANLEIEKKEFVKLTAGDEVLTRFVNGLGVQKEGGEEAAARLYEVSKKLNVDWLQFPEMRKAIIALLLSNEMQGEGLFYELENLKNEIYKQLARTEEEKKIVSLDHDLRFLADMLSLGSTREVWNSVKENKDSLKPVEWLRRFNEFDLGARQIDPKRIEVLEKTFEHAFDFYDLAEKREGVFMTRIQETLKNNASGNVIVVSGGFHSEGLERASRNQNFDFSVIQPELHKKSDLTHYYQAVFQSSALPFLTSKMAAEPFQETSFNAEVLAAILEKLEKIPADELAKEVNGSSFMIRNGGQMRVASGRFEFEPSASSLGREEVEKAVAPKPELALEDIEASLETVAAKHSETLKINIVPAAESRRDVTSVSHVMVNEEGRSIHRIGVKLGTSYTPEEVLVAIMNETRNIQDAPEVAEVTESMRALALRKAPEIAAQNPVLFETSNQLRLFPEDVAAVTAKSVAQTAETRTVSSNSTTVERSVAMFPTEAAIEALTRINRTAKVDATSFLVFDEAFLTALRPEIVGENLAVYKKSRLEVRGVNIRIGRNLAVQGNVKIQVAPTGRLIIGNNVALGNLLIVVGAGQEVAIGSKVNLTGIIEALPFSDGTVGEFPALLVSDGSRVRFPSLSLAPGAQLIVPPGITGNTQGNVSIPVNQFVTLVESPNSRPGISNALEPQPNPLGPIRQSFPVGSSLGTPSNLVPPAANSPRPVSLPTPVPGSVPFLDQGGNFQDFLNFVNALRAAVPPSGISPEKTSEILDSVSGDSALLTPLIGEDIVSLDVNPDGARLSSMQASLGGISKGLTKQFLSRLIHDLRNYRVTVTVGVSDPKGIYSLNNPEFRDSVEFHLETNPNAIFRFVHLGSAEEVVSINEYFSRFQERFQTVQADPENWNDALRGLFGEDLLKAVQRRPAGLEVRDMEALYKGRFVAVILPKVLWQANPELPNSSIVKVTSLVHDSKLSSQVSRNAKLTADLAFLEVSLAQLVSLYKGSYKDLSQIIPYEIFSYSEGRFSLNSESVLSGLLEDIHQQALTLLKLAYQA